VKRDDFKSKNTPALNGASAVDVQHLRYAVAAAEHGSFRRAAEVMLLRQSTLSRTIRQLEERIQMIVFERSSGGVRATEGGRDFLRAARSILDQMDALVTRASSTGRGEGGWLSCALQSTHVSWLPGAPFAGSASSRQPSNIFCWRFSDVSFSVNVRFAPED
jgi:DNA-binding transcriptional LysR family regulator